MKRRTVLQYIQHYNCFVLREGGAHTMAVNLANNQIAAIPRHPEIKPGLVRRICKQRGIPPPREK